MTDDPMLTRSVQATWRDRSLLQRAYREAKRRNDFGQALKYAQAGDQMGIPVGRPTNVADIEGAGEQRYMANLERSGGSPQPGGLDGFDFRHSNEGGPGVGGYDFSQRSRRRQDFMGPQMPQPQQQMEGGLLPAPSLGDAQMDSVFGLPQKKNIDPGFTDSPPPRPSPGMAQEEGIVRVGANRYRGNQLMDASGGTNSGSIGGYDFAQTRTSPLATMGSAAYPSVHNVDRRAAFSRAWNSAKTQDEKDALVERAYNLGVPMNKNGELALARRRSRSLS